MDTGLYTEEQKLQLALELIESTDAWEKHYEDLDWGITRAAYHLREHINGNNWV